MTLRRCVSAGLLFIGEAFILAQIKWRVNRFSLQNKYSNFNLIIQRLKIRFDSHAPFDTRVDFVRFNPHCIDHVAALGIG